MSVLPVKYDQVQLTAEVGTVYQNGVLMAGEAATFATSGPVVYSNGIARTATGAIFTVDATAGLPSGTTWTNGLPFSPLGALCVSNNSVATWSNGIPFDSAGAVCVGYGIPTPALDLALTSALDERVTFTRASSATRFNSSGVLETVANNVARFDHDPVTLAPLGLLIEEQRTNLLLQSATLSTQTITVTAVAHTLSFYGTGTVTLSGASTGAVVGTGAFPSRRTFAFTPTAGSLTLTVTGTVQFAQVEVGASATSYIPTTTAAATRAADVAVMTGTNFSSWYNQSEGTFFVEAKGVENISGASTRLIVDAFSDNNNRILVGYNTLTTSRFASVVATTNEGQVFVERATGQPLKVAAAYKVNDFNQATNGLLGIADTTGTLPTPTQLALGVSGAAPSSSSNNLNGHIKRIQYWPTRLTNAQLQSLTA